MLSISLGQYHDTPMYGDALAVSNISHVKRSEGQQEDSTSVSLGCIKWNIDDVAS